jgi:hypothetical protein
MGLPAWTVLTESERFSPEQLEKIEAHYEAKYVCETCLKNPGGGWVNSSVSIFYQPDASKVPEGGSQWFGLFFKAVDPFDLHEDTPRQLCIVNAISATEHDIVGIVANNGDVIYSRYRHDYRWSPDGSVMIDGGRDYTRTSTCPIGMVTLRIIEDKLVLLEDREHGGHPNDG